MSTPQKPITEEDLRKLLDAIEETFRNSFWTGAPLQRWAHKREKEREYEADVRTGT